MSAIKIVWQRHRQPGVELSSILGVSATELDRSESRVRDKIPCMDVLHINILNLMLIALRLILIKVNGTCNTVLAFRLFFEVDRTTCGTDAELSILSARVKRTLHGRVLSEPMRIADLESTLIVYTSGFPRPRVQCQ